MAKKAPSPDRFGQTVQIATALATIIPPLVVVIKSVADAFSRAKPSSANLPFLGKKVILKSGADQNMVMATGNDLNQNGCNVHLSKVDVAKAHQFIIEDAGDGCCRILCAESRKCIDVKDFQKDNGSIVHLWDVVTNGANQKWRFTQDKDLWEIVSVHNDLVLDADVSAVSNDGCKLQCWTRHNGKNQRWLIHLV